MKPLAKKENMHVETLPNELAIYDKSNHKVHCLNTTAALVWEHADGTRTIDQLAEVLHQKLGIPKDKSVVLLALDTLQTSGLLESPGESAAKAQPSRREVGVKLALVGFSAAVLPAIAAVRSPTPPAASSNVNPTPA